MRAYELYDATTVKEAVDLLKAHGNRSVKVVGGGTDLIGGVNLAGDRTPVSPATTGTPARSRSTAPRPTRAC